MDTQLGFIFPGQGSQKLGMLSDLGEHQIINATFEEASDALGYNLWEVIQLDPNERLNSTDVTQPALLASSVALWRLWNESIDRVPSLLSGHSLGEYSALVCGGALAFADAIKLVKLRGELMQASVPVGTGAMAAILGLQDSDVIKSCEAVSAGIVQAVNFNAPGQVVIAGEKGAVDSAIENCKNAGARKAMTLPVSVPSHCALMMPASEGLAKALDQISISQPKIPVIQNVDAMLASSPEAIKKNLVAQLHKPVLWVGCVNEMKNNGITELVECGPGKVLTGLNKRIDKTISASAFGTSSDLETLNN